MELLTAIFAFGLGLCFGSFALATAWRLRKKRNFVTDTSECEHCHHKLAAKDLVPLGSWLSTKGRCRYCGHKLSVLLPLAELTGAAAFGVSYVFWPTETTTLGIVRAVLWTVALVLLLILFFYDLQWQILPNKVMYPLWGVAAADAVVQIISTGVSGVVSMAGGVVVAWGIFWGLWHVSGGTWIGYGDVRLGFAMGLLLGSPWLASVALFTASVCGIAVSLPSLISGKKSMKTKIPFGPLLIIGLIVARIWGTQLVDWYTTSVLLLG